MLKYVAFSALGPAFGYAESNMAEQKALLMKIKEFRAIEAAHFFFKITAWIRSRRVRHILTFRTRVYPHSKITLLQAGS